MILGSGPTLAHRKWQFWREPEFSGKRGEGVRMRHVLLELGLVVVIRPHVFFWIPEDLLNCLFSFNLLVMIEFCFFNIS